MPTGHCLDANQYLLPLILSIFLCVCSPTSHFVLQSSRPISVSHHNQQLTCPPWVTTEHKSQPDLYEVKPTSASIHHPPASKRSRSGPWDNCGQTISQIVIHTHTEYLRPNRSRFDLFVWPNQYWSLEDHVGPKNYSDSICHQLLCDKCALHYCLAIRPIL